MAVLAPGGGDLRRLVDPPELRRLKGDRRVMRLILRGLRNRQRVEAVPVPLTVDGQAVEKWPMALDPEHRQQALLVLGFDAGYHLDVLLEP